MDTQILYEFYILSQTLNFSKAAGMLFISQSTLSKHISELETYFGVKLLLRDTHRVSLTEAGQYLATHSTDLIDKCNKAQAILAFHNLSITGTISIACEEEISYGSHIMIFLNRFRERYPDIELQITIIQKSDSHMLHGDFDFIFSPCAYAVGEDCTQLLLHRHETYLALPPGHGLITRSKVHLADLSGETVYLPYMDDLLNPYSKNAALIRTYTHNKAKLTAASNIQTALFAVSLGQGVSIIPRYARKLSAGDIFLVRIDNASCTFDEYLYYNASHQNPSANLLYKELYELSQKNRQIQ